MRCCLRSLKIEILFHLVMSNYKNKTNKISKQKNDYDQEKIKPPSQVLHKKKKALDLLKKGDLKEAEKIYRELIASGEKNHVVYGNLAAIVGKRGNKIEMISLLKNALRIEPNFPIAHNNLGTALKERGELSAAIVSYQKAIELQPNYPDAFSNLGNAFKEKGDLSAAIVSYQKAIELNPNFADAYNNLGTALQDQDNLRIAIASYQKAIELNPSFADAYNNLGTALKEQGHFKSAISSYQKALYLNPKFTNAYWNLSLVQLLIEDYKNGWKNYEWRLKRKDMEVIHAKLLIPKWKGESLEIGSKLLVISEQGLGDTIQYMRYILYLREKGIDVCLCAPKKLHNLIKNSKIDSNPLTPDQANKHIQGKWISLLSLPQYLSVDSNNVIISKPYISAKNSHLNKWNQIVKDEKKPIIGLNWQGNPNMEKTYRGRSIPLEMFSKIFEKNEFTLLSLQKGFGSDQLESCSFRQKFVKCQEQIDSTWDFLETAAIIDICDLIITCDTSVAHLAGGMGKKVWLLLRDIPFWTWGMHGERTLWYPSMRLFRQKNRYNWLEVMERVLIQLNKEFVRKR